jgi:hypothetical protein
MNAPGVWGPHLWAVLHRIGFHAGKAPEKLARDERREFEWLINHLETVVPCAECRAHIEEYRRARKGFSPASASASRWIWEFHEAVNARLGKSGVDFSSDLGSSAFAPNKTLRQLWKTYTDTILTSVQVGFVTREAVSEFSRHLFLWQGFACI